MEERGVTVDMYPVPFWVDGGALEVDSRESCTAL